MTKKTSVDRIAELILNPEFKNPNEDAEKIEYGYFPEDFKWVCFLLITKMDTVLFH